MIRLMFVSDSTVLVEGNVLRTMAAVQANRNKPQKIGGVLGYRDGHFFQVLEGPERAVLELFDCIERDPRHCNVRLLHAGPIKAPIFAGMPMVALEPGLMERIGLELLEVAHERPWDETGAQAVLQHLLEVLRGSPAMT